MDHPTSDWRERRAFSQPCCSGAALFAAMPGGLTCGAVWQAGLWATAKQSVRAAKGATSASLQDLTQWLLQPLTAPWSVCTEAGAALHPLRPASPGHWLLSSLPAPALHVLVAHCSPGGRPACPAAAPRPCCRGGVLSVPSAVPEPILAHISRRHAAGMAWDECFCLHV